MDLSDLSEDLNFSSLPSLSVFGNLRVLNCLNCLNSALAHLMYLTVKLNEVRLGICFFPMLSEAVQFQSLSYI